MKTATRKPNRERPILNATVSARVKEMVVNEAARTHRTVSDLVEAALCFYAEKKGIEYTKH